MALTLSEILKVWAADSVNVSSPTQGEIGDGLIFGSNIVSNNPNAAYQLVWLASQYLQRTAGLYSPLIPYIYPNQATIIQFVGGEYFARKFIRTTANPGDTTNNPPITGASLATTDGITVYSGGSDNSDWSMLSIDHDNLINITSDQHHAQAHTLASHSSKDHLELTTVTSDQHHPQSHTLTSHSTKAHSELTSIGTDNHHAQVHALNSANHTGDLAYTQLDSLVATSGAGTSTTISRADHAHSGSDGSSTLGSLPYIPITGSTGIGGSLQSSADLQPRDLGIITKRWRDGYFWRNVWAGASGAGGFSAEQYNNPTSDNFATLGASGLRWSDIWATNTHFGDLAFEERDCPLCKGDFKKDEMLCLIVKNIRTYDGKEETNTIPVHLKCAMEKTK